MIVVNRKTSETEITVEVAIGDGNAKVETGIDFFDHMLVTLARYSGLDITVAATGDLDHHLIEDVAISIGAALAQLAPSTAARYGARTVPMDDALVSAALDIGNRNYYEGELNDTMYEHFFRSLTDNARFTLHIDVQRGRDAHHIIEAAFKAFGLSLRDALQDNGTVFSTKGSVQMEVREC